MNRFRINSIWLYLLVMMVIMYAISSFGGETARVPEIDSTELIQLIQKDQIKSIEQKGNILNIQTTDDKEYTNYMPSMLMFSFYDDYLKDKIDNNEIMYSGTKVEDNNWQWEIGSTLLMVGGFAFLWFFMVRQMQGAGNKTMQFGRSKAQQYEAGEDIKISFKDVAGLHEEKEELIEIVDFLRDPKKYTEVGARIPTGVLMVGPPGTGKTYLSRAVAGEAGVPFFTISGSEFVEMFVGVGASRVRDLFENAKKKAPAIIFIDEIDAVGRRRGAGVGGGHDEREQTLNQLLVEMDGFSRNEGIIVMAATNRADILDPALLRPGRFDRRIEVGLPDVRGREQILEVHTKNKPLSEDVNLRTMARRTPGFSPADLENMVNEAALLTARQNESEITMDTMMEAEIKVLAGPAKKSAIVSDKDREITAYHEAGHAVVARLLPEYDPIHMITIIPRGRAGGFTAYVPDEDEQYYRKSVLENNLVTLLGGRVAEELVFGDITTGASNDIERATSIARAMVTTYGMSNLGTIKYGQEDHEVFMGRDLGSQKHYSEEVAAKIDKEVKKIIDKAYNTARELLSENMDKLKSVSEGLLEYETLNGEEFEVLFEGGSLEEVEELIEKDEKEKEDAIKEAEEKWHEEE